MSVTFTIEGNPTGAFTAECYNDGDPIILTGDDYDAILLAMTAHKMGCEDCAAYGIYSQPVMDVPNDDVNLNNGNAALVAARLGLPVTDEGVVGQEDGEAFLGRVLLALAQDGDDSGVAPQGEYAKSGRGFSALDDAPVREGEGARVIDCGVRPGMFAETFAALHALASEAARLGREVQWS
jgi:hypothetical protein